MTLPAPYCQRTSDDPQLRSHGCGPFSLLWLSDVATANDLSPDTQVAIDKRANNLVGLSGVSRADFLRRGTTLDECETAYEAQNYKPFNRVPPRMRKFHGGSIRDDLLPELEDGSVAMVAVSYGVVQDAGKGVGTYRGGHWVSVARNRQVIAGHVWVADPLRRVLTTWPIDLLTKAAESFGSKPWGNGRGEFGVVAMSPTFLEQCQARRDTLKSQLEIVRTENLRLRADLARCMDGEDCSDEQDAAHNAALDAVIVAAQGMKR